MAYPDRTAVINPTTPDIDLVLRQVTLGEGAIPTGTADYSSGTTYVPYNDPYSFKSGAWRAREDASVATSNPDYLSIIGFSKFGWGRINAVTGSGGISTGVSLGWTQGFALTSYGGALKEPGQTVSGVYDYVAAITSNLASFDGGTVTFTPSYSTISVDWGITTAQEPVTWRYGYTFESPVSTTSSPAIFQPMSFTLTIDPYGINNVLCALETRNDAGVLELNTKILFDYPVDGSYTYDATANPKAIWTDPVTPSGEINWVVSKLNDGSSLKAVLTSFEYLPMWPSVGVFGTPIYTHYTPLINDPDFGNVNIDSRTIWGTTSGFVVNYSTGLYANFVLVQPDWTTYQRINLIGGEQAWCDAIDNGDVVRVFQDTDGSWLVVTYNITTEVATLWVSGAPEAGFTGCPFDPSFPVWPVPTPPVGNPLIRSWGFSQDGHDFYVLRLGEEGTLIYDATTQQWSEWDGSSVNYWRATLGLNWIGIGRSNLNAGCATNVIAGDIEQGILWSLDPEQGYDETPDASPYGDYFTRAVRGGVPFRGRHRSRTNGVWLTISNGTPEIPYAAVTLRTSDDQGVTWTSRGTITVTPSDYNQDLYWRSLGLMRAPGRLFEFEDDGAMIRIDGATIDMSKDDQGGDS